MELKETQQLLTCADK